MVSLLWLLAVCAALDLDPESASAVTVVIEPGISPVWFLHGRSLTLTCKVNKENLEVVWTKNLDPLEDEEYKITNWTSVGENGTTFTNVRLTKDRAGDEDIADYRCSVGGADSIVSTASFSVFTRDANTTEGAESTLTCRPELEIVGKSVAWLKDGVMLKDIEDIKDRVDIDNYTVSFRNTKLSDSGVYTCRVEIASNKEVLQVFQENVVLQGRPYIQNTDSPELNWRVTDSSVILTCPTGGYPVPEVFWFRGGEILETSDKFLVTALNGQPSRQLEILDKSLASSDKFSCTAENILGKASHTFEVKDSKVRVLGFLGSPASGLRPILGHLGVLLASISVTVLNV